MFQTSQKEINNEITIQKENNESFYSRTTLIVKTDTYEKIKAIAFWERKPIKDLVDKALCTTLSEYSFEQLDEIVKCYKQNNI